MSVYIHCDKCDEVFKTEEDLKMASTFNFDGKRYDLCKRCSELFYEWIKAPIPWSTVIEKKEKEEEEDDTKDIDEAFSNYNNSKMKEKKENDSGLDYPIEKFIDQHIDVLFPTDLKRNGTGGMADYGVIAKTRFINKIKKLQINTIKQFLYSFSDMASFRSLYGNSPASMKRYYAILRILKLEGYYDNFSIKQKKLLEKMDEELKLKRGNLCDSGTTK